MIGARELSEKLKLLSLNLPSLLVESVNDLSNEIEYLQKDQFNAGLSSDGKNFATSIIDDPYFKGNKKSALRYAEYKKKNPKYIPKYDIFPDRDLESPNLILSSGSLVYNRLDISVKDNSIIVLLESPIMLDLTAKYGDFLGLNNIAFKFFRENIFLPYLAKKIKEYVM